MIDYCLLHSILHTAYLPKILVEQRSARTHAQEVSQKKKKENEVGRAEKVHSTRSWTATSFKSRPRLRVAIFVFFSHLTFPIARKHTRFLFANSV